MPTRITSSNPAIAKLVERQMRNWELARDQRVALGVPEPAVVEDFICVSRQVSADGKSVAEKLGARLSWPVFDREILDAMAGDDDVRRQIYESMDQRDLTWWEETLRSLMQSEFVRNDYFRRLSETLLSLARQGNCVFLGRGADLLLPKERGFRVRLVAPHPVRVERFAEIRRVPLSAARKEVDRLEAERRKFFRHHFGVDTDDPTRFDMTINLARCSGDEAVEMILRTRGVRTQRS